MNELIEKYKNNPYFTVFTVVLSIYLMYQLGYAFGKFLANLGF